MLIYNSYFLCYKCCDPLLDFFSFFFLKNTLKDESSSAIFLMKTLLTLKYPVFIRVTNSNSKVHPFIDSMWWRPSSAGILSVLSGEKPGSWSLSPLPPFQSGVNWVSGTYQFHLKNFPPPEAAGHGFSKCVLLGKGHLWNTVLRSSHGSEVANQGTGSLLTRTDIISCPNKLQWTFSSQKQLAPI